MVTQHIITLAKARESMHMSECHVKLPHYLSFTVAEPYNCAPLVRGNEGRNALAMAFAQLSH